MANLLFGLAPVCVKFIEISAVAITFGRGMFAWLVLVGWLVLRPVAWTKQRGIWLQLAATGVLMAISWTTFFMSIKTSSVAISTIALYTYPLMIAILEPILTKTRVLTKDDIIHAILVIIGLGFVVEFAVAGSVLIGLGTGLIAAFSLALRNIWVKKELLVVDPTLIIAVHTSITALLLAPLGWTELLSASISDWMWTIILGIGVTAIAHSLYVIALRSLSAKSVGILASIQPIYAIGFAWLILGESITLYTLIGASLVIGVIIRETRLTKKA